MSNEVLGFPGHMIAYAYLFFFLLFSKFIYSLILSHYRKLVYWEAELLFSLGLFSHEEIEAWYSFSVTWKYSLYKCISLLSILAMPQDDGENCWLRTGGSQMLRNRDWKRIRYSQVWICGIPPMSTSLLVARVNIYSLISSLYKPRYRFKNRSCLTLNRK